MKSTKKTIVLFYLFFISLSISAQINPGQLNGSSELNKQVNPVSTAVPFLTITPDSRAGAMGDVGVATSPDNCSNHWNPAKYAFIRNKLGFSVSYSPWLHNLVGDIDLAYLSFYKKIGKQQAFSASLRYFSLGDIQFTDRAGYSTIQGKPNEFALDAAYSRLLSEKFSGAVAFRYIRSDISIGTEVNGVASKAGQSFAADVSMYYHTDFSLFDADSKLALGLNISNIGSKLTYTSDLNKDFIPTNMRIGFSYIIELDKFNSFTIASDLNKLLVPTAPVYWKNAKGSDSTDINGSRVIRYGMNPHVSVVKGVFQSFADAPGGFQEELREFTYGIGVEYLYYKKFAIRGGYFHENKYKGNRKYFTLGLGIQFNSMGIDFSYLVPINSSNPLANTLRFTINFNFGPGSKKKTIY